MYTTKKAEWEAIPELYEKKVSMADEELEKSYQHCMNWMEVHSKSFFFASRFLPGDQRKNVAALYAFCRITDDIVDEAPEGTPASVINEELDRLKNAVTKLSKGYTSDEPIFRAFGDTITKNKIPVEYMHDLIEGVRMDLNKTDYTTDIDLDQYMYRVASTVGLMMTHIFLDDPAPHTLERAADLGKAMQLTNILRDIKEDFERGRIYLPESTRKLYGVSRSDLVKTETSENLKKIIQFESVRAKNYYARADLGIKDLPPESAYTIKVASSVYGDILNEIRRMDYQVLRKRAVVSKLRKILIATKVRLEYFRKI